MKNAPSLQEIKDELIKYGKKREENWHFEKKGNCIKCLDTFTLNYMVKAIDYFISRYL